MFYKQTIRKLDETFYSFLGMENAFVRENILWRGPHKTYLYSDSSDNFEYSDLKKYLPLSVELVQISGSWMALFVRYINSATYLKLRGGCVNGDDSYAPMWSTC